MMPVQGLDAVESESPGRRNTEDASGLELNWHHACEEDPARPGAGVVTTG